MSDSATVNLCLVDFLQLNALLCAVLLCADYLISGSNALGVWDMNTTQLLFTLDAPTATPSSSPGLSISSSAASLAATAAAAAAGTSAAAAAAAAADQDSEDDEDLLQNWLMQDDESDSDLSDEEEALPVGVAAAAQQQHHQAAGAAAATAGVGQGGSGSRSGAASAPWTSISCHGNLLAAGQLQAEEGWFGLPCCSRYMGVIAGELCTRVAVRVRLHARVRAAAAISLRLVRSHLFIC